MLKYFQFDFEVFKTALDVFKTVLPGTLNKMGSREMKKVLIRLGLFVFCVFGAGNFLHV
jgi:hypothetical protein